MKDSAGDPPSHSWTRSQNDRGPIPVWEPALGHNISRGERIRTSDLLLPKQALYRAKLRPDQSVKTFSQAEGAMLKTSSVQPPAFNFQLPFMRPERLELPTF